MINDKIEYSTIEKQIEKLKSQNLIINDTSFAKDMLRLYGYSNLIKSYREPYMIISDNQKFYRSEITFEQLCSLYTLDKNLRNNVMAAMQDLEEHIKEAAANVVSQSFGVHQNSYLQYRNYQNKKKSKQHFSLPWILDTMQKTLSTDKDPIHHYLCEHGIVPPWILFKSIYFSTIINFINLFKPKEQEKMVEQLYDTASFKLSMEAYRKLMMDTLFICLEYRNISAHGGRIYNYSNNSKLRVDEIFTVPLPHKMRGFSQLTSLLHLLKYQKPFERLASTLESEVNRHCNQFPQDVAYLSKVLNFDIVPTHVVWITKHSNKYHSDMHCSGIKNTSAIELPNAEKQGYIPCKKCNH